MSGGTSIAASAPWLKDADLQRLLTALSDGDDEARIAGGAVRNALLGQDVSDIDIATTTLPDETIRRVEAAGFKAVKTGYEHGTITAVGGGHAFEVTTLRADIETDGRRAIVHFGRDWQDDADRRDFTINALYATADGTVIDPVGGMADIEGRVVRFIGDADMRIREDYLRILRFFRFFAWYGDGRPDAAGLKACARLKDGLGHVSAERIWQELKKLLMARDPSRSLLWMRQAGALTAILPESQKWGIDAVHGLVKAETGFSWPPDPLLRLMSMVPPDADRLDAMAKRLRLSNAERDRLRDFALTPPLTSGESEFEFAKALYRGSYQGYEDRLRLLLTAARTRAVGDDAALHEAAGYARLLAFTESWQKPEFPLSGKDLAEYGQEPGPEMGRALAVLESEWIDSGFAMTREALLAKLSV